MSVQTLPVLGTSTRDPFRDPQVGDCLKRGGAKHRWLYRLVIVRDGMRVQFLTGHEAVSREVWLSSWQDWSASADLEYLASGTPMNAADFFANVMSRDQADRRRKAD